MEETNVVTRDGSEFIRIGIGDAGDGEENSLQMGPYGVRVLQMDHSRFLLSVYNSLPLWNLCNNCKQSTEQRKRLRLIAVTGGTGGRGRRTERGFAQITLILDGKTVVVFRKNHTDVFVPIRSFIERAISSLGTGTLTEIDLSWMQYWFSVAFEERWKAHVFWEPKVEEPTPA